MFASGTYRVERIDAKPTCAVAAVADPPAGKPCSHSLDFASVLWHGQAYSFTPTQRRIVAVLWAAWEQGTPDVSEATVLREADSDSDNLRMLFRGHPAFGTMIQRSSQNGGPCGCFRIS